MSPVPFSAMLASEWTKLRSLRATYVTVGLAILLAIAASGLVGLVSGLTWDEWDAGDRADYDPVLFSLTGTIFSSVLFTVLAITSVTSEYSSGMARVTLTATPRRGRVLAAKAVVVAGVTMVGGLIATAGMFLSAQVVLGAYDLPTAGLFDADALRTVVGVGLITPLLPIIGLCLAFVLRSTAGAITSVFGLTFGPLVFGSLLPASWQDDVLAYLPVPASDSATLSHMELAGTGLSMGAGIAVTAAWIGAFLALGHLALTRRDA